MSQRRRRLRDLALVVREHQIHPPPVNIERLAQILRPHRRTLHVPPRKTLAPRTRPPHDMLRRSPFPQREIRRETLFPLIVLRPSPRLHVVQIPARQYPVIVAIRHILPHIEVDRPVAHIRIPRIQNRLRHRNLLDDMSRRVRLDRRSQHPQPIHKLVIPVGIVLRHLHRLQLLQPRLFRNLVLPLVRIVFQVPHIRDVPHITHLVPLVPQQAEQQVERHRRPHMPQVRIAVDRRPAHVHPHSRCMQRRELLLAPGQGIVKVDRFGHTRKRCND